MENILDKSDNTPGASGELAATQYNDHKNEIQTSVERSGQLLSSSSTPNQLGRAMFINGTGASTVIDSSADPNLIQISPITGGSGLIAPDSYAQLNGCVFDFDKLNANTSTAVAVNFGQTGTELGTRPLVKQNGTQVSVGEVTGNISVRYDLVNDYWVLSRTIDQFLPSLSKTRAMLSWYDVQNLGGAITSMGFGNDLFLAGLSLGGGIYTSIDTISWTFSQNLGTTINSISYGNSIYIASLGNGEIYRSSDGIAWTFSQDLGSSARTVSFGNGTFVAGSGSDIYRSIDGITWTLSQSFTGDITAITFGNGLFISGSSIDEVYRSSNGITWTLSQDLGSNQIIDIIFGDNIYLLSNNNGDLYTSADGISWSLSKNLGANANALIFGNGLYIAGLFDGKVFTSSESNIWTERIDIGEISQSGVFGNNLFSIGTAQNKVWIPDLR